MQNLPNRIRQLREAAGLSQADLAGLASTSYQQIDRLEKGERALTAKWCEAIGNALRVWPWELLPEEKNPEYEELELQLIVRAMKGASRSALKTVALQMLPKKPTDQETP